MLQDASGGEDQLIIVNVITEAQTALTDTIEACKEGIHMFSQILEEARLGRISPLSFAPDFMMGTLSNISLQLGLTYPVEINNEYINQVYSMIDVQAFAKNCTSTVVCKIPLVKPDPYTMNGVTPFPYPANSSNCWLSNSSTRNRIFWCFKK